MNFLKTAFWVIIAVALALFAKANWVIVTVKLWGDTVLDARLPVLIVLAFLLGWCRHGSGAVPCGGACNAS